MKEEATGIKPAVTRSLLRRVQDELKPGDDLRVTTTTGATYSGVLVIEENIVRGGLVARNGGSD